MVSRRLLVLLAPNRRAGAIKPTSLQELKEPTKITQNPWQAEKTVYPGFQIANTFPRSRLLWQYWELYPRADLDAAGGSPAKCRDAAFGSVFLDDNER
ncbi:hypothetical protein C8Q74DRAFT_777510 [Fomes fomentarius]|nr:hypothetical protein C8Q74DRAFT_777510 [Fomes fomentarius]